MNTSALTQILQKLTDAQQLPGVSAFIMGPQGPVFSFHSGIRNAAGDTPDEETLFGIASMSKSMTALCACILAAEGRISLDDPVSKYIPSFHLPGQPDEACTIRHLGTHTSGIPPMEPLEWSIAMNTPGRMEDPDNIALCKTAPNSMSTIAEIISYIADCPYPLLGAPGEIFSYSNEGYAVLSYVIDAAAGIPLEDYMQQHIFTPLGMTRSVLDNGIDTARALSGGNITSLFEEDGPQRTCDDVWSCLPPFRGCAMVKSCSRDVARYYQVLASRGQLNGEQVLPEKAVEMLIGQAYPLLDVPVMCMGLKKRMFHDHVICEHAGGLHGVSTMGGLLKDEGYGFAVLCNHGDKDASPLLYAMMNAVMGLPLSASHEWFHPLHAPFSADSMLLGTYMDHEGLASPVTIQIEDNHLVLAKKQRTMSLVYCSGARFLAYLPGEADPAYHVEFLIRNGHAWAMRLGTRVLQLSEE